MKIKLFDSLNTSGAMSKEEHAKELYAFLGQEAARVLITPSKMRTEENFWHLLKDLVPLIEQLNDV